MKSNLQNRPELSILSESNDPTVCIKTEQHLVESISRQHWISVAAYYKAKVREFVPGKELNDWLEAEKDYSKKLVALYLSMSNENGGMTISGLQQIAKLNAEKLIYSTTPRNSMEAAT